MSSADPPASSSKPTSSSKPAMSDAELDKILNREASAFQRENEVNRILKAFKLNPYEVLDLPELPAPTETEVKKKYKQLSLFIHPDKCPHPQAPDAFDLLKKAEAELSDENKREELDAIVNQARVLVLKSLNLPSSTPITDARVTALTPSFAIRIRAQNKELMIDEEVRRRKAIKMNLANEGLEARKKDEEVAARKRKAEDEKEWEAGREQRVGSWRTFASGPKKKKKTKPTLLG